MHGRKVGLGVFAIKQQAAAAHDIPGAYSRCEGRPTRMASRYVLSRRPSCRLEGPSYFPAELAV
jgi:hypothetical protein